MPGIFHQAGCCCGGCPCLGDEPALTVEFTGSCTDEGWFALVDYWEVDYGFRPMWGRPWCEIQWSTHEPGSGWCYLLHDYVTDKWFAYISVDDTAMFGPSAGGEGDPIWGQDVTGLVDCVDGQITGAFDLDGVWDFEGCTASCVIG